MMDLILCDLCQCEKKKKSDSQSEKLQRQLHRGAWVPAPCPLPPQTPGRAARPRGCGPPSQPRCTRGSRRGDRCLATPLVPRRVSTGSQSSRWGLAAFTIRLLPAWLPHLTGVCSAHCAWAALASLLLHWHAQPSGDQRLGSTGPVYLLFLLLCTLSPQGKNRAGP